MAGQRSVMTAKNTRMQGNGTGHKTIWQVPNYYRQDTRQHDRRQDIITGTRKHDWIQYILTGHTRKYNSNKI
jgi:hypothetical protein